MIRSEESSNLVTTHSDRMFSHSNNSGRGFVCRSGQPGHRRLNGARRTSRLRDWNVIIGPDDWICKFGPKVGLNWGEPRDWGMETRFLAQIFKDWICKFGHGMKIPYRNMIYHRKKNFTKNGKNDFPCSTKKILMVFHTIEKWESGQFLDFKSWIFY